MHNEIAYFNNQHGETELNGSPLELFIHSRIQQSQYAPYQFLIKRHAYTDIAYTQHPILSSWKIC